MTMTEPEHSLFSILADLKLTIGDLSQSVKKRDQLQRQATKAESPSYNKIHGTVILNSSGYGVIRFDLAGPSQGYVWHLKQLAIGGLTVSTVVTGRADIFAFASDLRQTTSLADVGLSGWMDTTTSLPAVTSYGDGELFCHAGEELWVVISGGTSGQQVSAIGVVKNVQESAAKQETAV